MNFLKKLGPGLLFAGAAIGVSHLVQSTRAGADFGFGLLWALLLVNLFKYPFFQFGPRYAMATGESLLEGYQKLGKGVLLAYFALSLGTMVTIQAAVTIVTAGLAVQLFGITTDITLWCFIITAICFAILIIGKYKVLDTVMKVIISILTVTTVIAVASAVGFNESSIEWTQVLPKNNTQWVFLIAFMGWMPAPLDVSVWHSLWTIEKQKTLSKPPNKNMIDFKIGYLITLFLGVCFLSLGALVMFGSGQTFSNQGVTFSKQLIDLYTTNLGSGAFLIIALAAFTTMFSTTLTCLDASPRAMAKTSELLNFSFLKKYTVWLAILAISTLIVLVFFLSEMGLLVKIATVLSFLTAPFYAVINLRLITSQYTPKAWRPSLLIKIISVLGIVFLLGFSFWYLSIL
jgi:Mn2+/Fe2+ NRAMP family transporter